MIIYDGTFDDLRGFQKRKKHIPWVLLAGDAQPIAIQNYIS